MIVVDRSMFKYVEVKSSQRSHHPGTSISTPDDLLNQPVNQIN
jgi:hypothetical protein